ncbi:terminase large subunit domain-containing protein [Chrysiogenes arsenatis]|uniref:terminase large subunit domain-containing protein n=1 Tax=Chrysiogenes arsenatis TaxID=309797 RepID=UPI0003FB980B|nr:terminase family protein [Chrysiogenes arsenatis]
MNALLKLAHAARELERRKRYAKIDFMYPEEGKLSRHAYFKHMEFYAAGAKYRERAIIAGNRVGKTELGACETVYHMTGRYPAWWQGRRFSEQVSVWAAGDTTQTVRDIMQHKLLGDIGDIGSGLIPKDFIIPDSIKRKAGSVPDAIESFAVRHVSGGLSRLTFKSFDQKRLSFQGTHKDWIWLDEECPMDVYGECVMRTMDTGGANGAGMIGLTFTPLSGLTEVVLQFLPGGRMPDGEPERFVVMAGWDDAPHLSEYEKEELLKATPPYLRNARSKGLPQLGSGAIYPIDEEVIRVTDFAIPEHWPRAYALDVGWNNTAALWGAWDRDNGDILYLTNEYKQGQCEPAVHAAAIRARGEWIPGVIDPAARGRNQKDGTKLIEEYETAGLNLVPAENTVEAGLFTVYRMMTEGRLRVFGSLSQWFNEFRTYHRDKDGKVIKTNDHLMDDTRYLVMSGYGVAKVHDPRPKWQANRLAAHHAKGFSHMAQ